MYADVQADEAQETLGVRRPDGLFLRREDLISPENAALRARTVHTSLVVADLPPLAWRLMMWILRETLDRSARTIFFPHKAVAADLGLGERNAKNLGRAFSHLVAAGLIEYTAGTKGMRVSRLTIVSQAIIGKTAAPPDTPSTTPTDIKAADALDQAFERARRALTQMSRTGLPHASLGSRSDLARDFAALPSRYTRSSPAMVWTVGIWAGANDTRLMSRERVDELKKANKRIPEARVPISDLPSFCDKPGCAVPDTFDRWRQKSDESGQITLPFDAILNTARLSAL